MNGHSETRQQNTRLRTQHDHITDELLYFDYDELNRLKAVDTIDSVTPEGLRWGQSFTYDGFGNLTDKTVTKGSAPSWHVTVDKSTNRITGSGYEYNSDGTVRQILIPGECVFRAMPIMIPGRWRSRFRVDPDQDSGMMAIAVPG